MENTGLAKDWTDDAVSRSKRNLRPSDLNIDKSIPGGYPGDQSSSDSKNLMKHKEVPVQTVEVALSIEAERRLNRRRAQKEGKERISINDQGANGKGEDADRCHD